jgi:3',5'-cyclic AMP phosphodiesterase CpdA
MRISQGHPNLPSKRPCPSTVAVLVVLTMLQASVGGAAQTNLIFRENFEGNFPQDGRWTVGDQNDEGDPAFWDDVNLLAFGSPPLNGSEWVGYCAGAGYGGNAFQPFYQSSMAAFMSKLLDLGAYSSVTLDFWHTVPSIESGIDQCGVFINGQSIYFVSDAFGWTQTTLDLTAYAGTQAELAFAFFSDDSIEGEGWYVDDITVTGIESGPPSVVRGPYLQSGSMTNIIVCWRTDRAVESKVLFGPSPQQLSSQVVDLVPKTEHTVTLDGLQPDTRYYYAIANGPDVLASGEDFSFITSPATPKPTRLWVIGDSGSASAGVPARPKAVYDRYREFTGSRYTDLWLMLGDNAYYNGTDAEYQTAVFDLFPELLRQTVVWSTIGNHETYSTEEDGQHAYFKIFNLPVAAEAGGVPSGTENYYSFDYGNIHVVCLDSELSLRVPGGPMITWLEADLAANTKDWTIAMWHSPPYTKGSHDSDNLIDNFGNMTDMRANIVPILESFGVDLVLCGHSHNYERSYLMDGHYGFSDSLTPSMIKDAGSGRPGETGPYIKPDTGPGANQGTVYVVAGSSGWATFATGRHPIMHTALLEMGSLVIDIDGQRLDAKFLRETGAIDDYFSIIKGAPPAPLSIVSIHHDEGILSIRWKSQAGRTYRLEKTESLAAPDWQPAGEDVMATGATTSWTGGVASPNGRCFFRVMEVN